MKESCRLLGPTEAQTRQWDEDGYLVFSDAIAGQQPRRLQNAFDYWAEQCKADWLDRIERGEQAATFYDIPEPLEKDEIFVDIVDHPSYYGCLRQFTGAQPMFLAEQVRTVPLWPLSYTSWHPDVPHSNPLHIKIYVNDVDPGCGVLRARPGLSPDLRKRCRSGREFAFVPGSHKRTAGPYTRPVFQESMPGHRTFVGAAGTAVMFNAYGWHAAMDNHSGIPRKSIILIYEKLIGVRELLPPKRSRRHHGRHGPPLPALASTRNSSAGDGPTSCPAGPVRERSRRHHGRHGPPLPALPGTRQRIGATMDSCQRNIRDPFRRAMASETTSPPS